MGRSSTQRACFQIEAGTLDNIMLHDLGILNVGFIKMDTEGAEIRALEGGIETLK
jgi:FkbM family methyltransferase